MITFNVPQKLSSKVLSYSMTGAVIWAVIVTVAVTAVGLTIFREIRLFAPMIVVVFFALLFVYVFAWWKIFSYTVFTDHITIHSGVIFQETKTVNFNDIENVSSLSGPLIALFGLRTLKGFTSSPGQLVVSGSKNGTTTTYRPDINIILDAQTAAELMQLMQKSDVQKVENVTGARL